MGRRLYRFGHIMFGIMLMLGLWLSFAYKLHGGWLHAKLLGVAVLLGFFLFTGRWLKRAAAGGALPSSTALRLFNELPVLVTIPVIYLVLASRSEPCRAERRLVRLPIRRSIVTARNRMQQHQLSERLA
jgi:protoporphyrinogen IX oxidase